MEDKIFDYVKGIADKKGMEMDRDTNLFETGILDSLEILSLLAFLQKTLHLNIGSDDLNFENYQTINRIVKWANGVKG